jgi:hypothetical protein
VLGLYVVGRLGQRHGIKVQLRHSWYGGVTALTLLPHSVLVWPQASPAMPPPAVVPSRAELPPPEPEPAAEAEPVAPAAAAAEPIPSGDHLPIFEAARSDWFVTEPAEKAPLRQRQRQHERATADGAVVTDEPRPAPPAPTERPVPPAPAPRPYRPAPVAPPGPPAGGEPPTYRPEPVNAADDAPPPRSEQPLPRAAAEAQPRPVPEQGERMTQAGLPRRVPRANLAPGMVASQQAGGGPPPGQPTGRSPDEVRSMLSSYRTGIERGRTVAGSDPGERPPDTP